MSLSVEIIKKRKNTTAPWEVRAIQSVIKQNFWDSPLKLRNEQGCSFLNDGIHAATDNPQRINTAMDGGGSA